MAPEIITGNYDTKCDVWSCGIILYIMLCGHPPFNGRSEAEIMSKIARGVFNFAGKDWSGISREAKSLVQRMLTKDVGNRPTAQEIWNDPWIQSRAKGEAEDLEIKSTALQSLASFNTSSKLQQATLSYIASNLTSNQEISELKNAFVILDSNGDGHLSVSELKNGYSTITLSSAIDVQQILSKCDMDLNGTIDYNEFITATIDWSKHLSDDLLEAAFRAYDKDNSGTISYLEIKEFLGAEKDDPSEAWKAVLSNADTNGDGLIDFSEFKTLMISNIKEN